MNIARTKEALVQEFRMQAIREAACRVTAERGVAAATMEAIAEEAGIAKGTIYLYFKNREDLLLQVADHLFASLQEEVAAAFATPAPFAERLSRLVTTILRFFDQNRDLLRLFRAVAEAPGHDECCQRQHYQYERFVEVLTSWFERAAGRGEARPLPAGRAALLVVGALNEITRQRFQEASPPPVEEEAEWLVAALLGGLATPPAAPPAEPSGNP